jgi:sporulation-control protein
MVFGSFKRALGIGGPTLDAVLNTDRVEAGGHVSGMLHIRGGDPSQVASRATLELMARVEKKVGDEEYQVDEIIAGVQVPGPIYLGRDHSFPFGMQLPPYTPVTTLGGRNHVWIKSGLDVPWALDPSDRDYLQVFPNQPQNNVLQAMQQLGFRLAKVDIEARSAWMGRKWVQEFEFRPVTHGQMRYDEIEIVFEGQQGPRLDLLLQLDRSARGLGGFLAEMSGTDESWHRVSVDGSSPHSAASDLSRVIGYH